jgi:hypothetical protein
MISEALSDDSRRDNIRLACNDDMDSQNGYNYLSPKSVSSPKTNKGESTNKSAHDLGEDGELSYRDFDNVEELI